MFTVRATAILTAILFAYPAHAGRAGGVTPSQCRTFKYTPGCNAKDPKLDLIHHQCEQQKVENKCEQFAKDHPDTNGKLIDCDEFSTCPISQTIDAQIGACAGAVGEAWKDTAVSIFNLLSGKTTAPSEEQLKQIEFFKTCKTPRQKREMLGNFAFYFTKEEIEGHPERTDLSPADPANQNYLQGFSCAALYRQLLVRMKKDFAKRKMDEKFIQSWSGKEAALPGDLDQKIKRVPASLAELVSKALEKSGITNTACYKPEVVREMNCYAIAMVVDPLLLAGGALKLARVAGLVSAGAKVEKGAELTAAALKTEKGTDLTVDLLRAGGKTESAPSAISVGGAPGDFTPLKRPFSSVTQSQVVETETAVVRQLKTKGVKVTRDDGNTYLKWVSENENIPVQKNLAGETYYGSNLKIESLPPPSKNPNALTPALEHPEFKSYLEKVRAEGGDIVVDASLDLTGAAGIHNPVTKKIAVKPEMTWEQFLHEYQHYDFEKWIGPHFYNISGLAQKGPNLEAVLPKSMAKELGSAKIKQVKEILDQGVVSANTLNERLSLNAQLKSMGWRAYDPRSSAIGYRKYILRHQISDLQKYAAEHGGTLPAQQQALLDKSLRDYKRWEKLEKVAGSNEKIAATGLGATAVVTTGVAGAHTLNEKLRKSSEYEIPQGLSDFQSIIYKDGTAIGKTWSGEYIVIQDPSK